MSVYPIYDEQETQKRLRQISSTGRWSEIWQKWLPLKVNTAFGVPIEGPNDKKNLNQAMLSRYSRQKDHLDGRPRVSDDKTQKDMLVVAKLPK